MRTKGRFLMAVGLGVLMQVGIARGQGATRTWVSGVGDDANPCSRTAPCKTFAGAISKTAAGGEIDVLDPGGFGALTITKAIAIEGMPFVSGVLVSGTNGFIVAAGPSDNVIIRGLVFEGLGTGLAGISFVSGGSLHVENVTIHDFTGPGIDFEPTADGSKLFVDGSTVRKCLGGIKVKPGSGIVTTANVENTLLNDNTTFGLRVEDGATVAARGTFANGNLNGFLVTTTTGALPVLTLESCITSNNSAAGISAGFGGSGLATVFLGQSSVTGNGTGLHFDGNGAITSWGNNRVAGNATDGAPSGMVLQK
jgi:hypothetical protein